ncbi:site-specific integrase [Paenibacillus donghaensis]|uniref:Site-specific integrase n=1 Tax=Paenibacillus donghaensis TaxID=414771 RepID=A0A2Z2KNT5_9BACL|nr:site-specific integrase [Paenibacillus donghaensis]ASA21791.1 site-specific integrase [Paenibacillus donghaensis]
MAVPKFNEKTKTWRFVFDYYDETGERKQIRRKGFKTKREADDKMLELRNEVNSGQYSAPKTLTVANFIEDWLKSDRILQVNETTYYSNCLSFKNHIKPKIGNVRLQNLTPMQCQKFVTGLHEEGYARNTIDRIVAVVKRALDKAKLYKIIKENPMRNVTLPKFVKLEMKIWTIEQTKHFLRVAKDCRFYCAYALALYCGLRMGEISALRWQDIDIDKKEITINQTLVNFGKTIKNGAKTASGVRKVSMPNILIEILKKQQIKYEETKDRLGDRFIDMDIVIFNIKNGKTVFPGNLSCAYRKDLEKAQLPHIRFHDLRHTHATILIMENVNVKIISERMGHSKVGITLDTYSHVIPSMQQEVADTLDRVMCL